MIKTLALIGSPRKNGNSKKIVNQILKGIKSIKRDIEIHEIFLAKQNIQPCIACEGCHQRPGCIIRDDMQKLYPKFNQADLIIVASPVYFNSVSAQLKGMIDRCQAIWASKYILQNSIIDRKKYRLGIFVATAGNPEGIIEFEPSIRVIDIFFKSINTRYYKNFFVANTDKKPVAFRPEILKQAYQLGIEMVTEFLKEDI
ncbi:hypothetical protein BBF96_09870 [Anoxybacter fermentans]|uniref:NADPH-dependent FMN reductase-like domain-containing protein n=1 Tax=Anoxybacter fermentans TaxID=1323375 RepID=A0A3S9SZE4_9FIRM|nr:flavodoxin family protein [Anoxybacter fermentans]AZR73665.1 hypothetical protein BBF96_09870 [Anoxybacter fermentans]